ncbi:hypothetical protein K6W19_33550, partial [Pseudomonas protegens]|nr:hypothetical protein [Pseudomonas protegens]
INANPITCERELPPFNLLIEGDKAIDAVTKIITNIVTEAIKKGAKLLNPFLMLLAASFKLSI